MRTIKEALEDGSLSLEDEIDYADMTEEEYKKEIEKLKNKLKDIKSQLDYLETYSSKEDVFEDMKRRLDRINKIIGSDKE